MPVAPVDLVFARATSAHVAQLIVAGRQVVHDGRLTGVDLDAVHAACAKTIAATSPRGAVSGGVEFS